MGLYLEHTDNSLIFKNDFKTIELIKNSIAYLINYSLEIIEVSGVTRSYTEDKFFLYGSLIYYGVSEFSGQTDPDAPNGTSQNFQELVLFIKNFVDVSNPTGEAVETILDQHIGSQDWKRRITGNEIENLLDDHLGSTQWKTGGSGAPVWSAITGDITTQTDLQDQFNTKADKVDVEGSFSIVPVVHGTFRVRSQTVFPGWAYTSVGGGSTAYEEIEVEPETAYTFEDTSHVFDGLNDFIFLNGAGDAFARYNGPASGTIITPKECKKVVFSVYNANIGANFKFVKLHNYAVQKTERVGANLADGDYYVGWGFKEDGGQIGFVAGFDAISSSIPVREGETYYYYRTIRVDGVVPLAVGMDEDDNCVALITSDFVGYATQEHYCPIKIPEGIGIVKVMLLVAKGSTQLTNLSEGTLKFGLVEEANYRIVEDYKTPEKNKDFAQAVNELIDLRQAVSKVFYDKNLMIMGDSVYATQTDAAKAFYENVELSPSNQGTNKLRGGACAEIVRRLRPATWTNYSNGGWTMTYEGPYFGQDIYTYGGYASYLYNLEKFFVDYDAYIADPINNDPRYAPDVFMVASCINDFINPTEAWATDAEISASGLSYDQYMEDTFVSSGVSNDTLIPLENIDLTKVAGSLRYIIERVYRKFPKCYIVVITPNKTSNHRRENQYKCVRDMIWMAERLNVQVIDVFNKGNQMIPLKEFRDSVSGTRDELYLTQDGIHHYGSTGNGDQRHGRFITNELIKGYFGLYDF